MKANLNLLWLLMSMVSDQVVRLQEVAIYKNVPQSLRPVRFISLQTTKYDSRELEIEILFKVLAN